MTNVNKGVLLSSMTWYEDLLKRVKLVKNDGQAAVEGIVSDVPHSVLLTLDQENLFETVRKQWANCDSDNRVCLEAHVAAAILNLIVLSISDGLLDKYAAVFGNDQFLCLLSVPAMKKEREKMRARDAFLQKHFPR
jgi:hypothetical protein